MDASKLIDYLEGVGLEPQSVSLYLQLVQQGPSSALQLSKQSAISRTQVYRFLEELELYNLVSHEKLSYGTLYKSLPIENLESILEEREQTAKQLHGSLDGMSAIIRQLAGGPKDEVTDVRHYYGLAGIKQANWNLTKATNEFFVFEVAHITERLDRTFALRMRERCMQKGLVSHDLTNQSSITAKEMEPFNPSKTFYRYVDPKVLDISFELYIYDDTVTLIDYGPKMHAIEIQNMQLAQMMHQIYMAIWNQATPIEIT